MPDLSNARVGVIGGSGLYAIPGLDQVEELSLDTPFGRPSDVLRLGTLPVSYTHLTLPTSDLV